MDNFTAAFLVVGAAMTIFYIFLRLGPLKKKNKKDVHHSSC